MCADQELMKLVRALAYNPAKREGVIDMGPCCDWDMQWTVALFERIDPDVRCIYVRLEGTPDIAFVKNAKISRSRRHEVPILSLAATGSAQARTIREEG